jgi:hypothetical protein
MQASVKSALERHALIDDQDPRGYLRCLTLPIQRLTT